MQKEIRDGSSGISFIFKYLLIDLDVKIILIADRDHSHE